MPENDRSLIFPDRGTPAPIERRNHLLVIGVDGYEHCGKLANAVRDAKAFARLLIDKYDFSEDRTYLLTDEKAGKQGITTAFRELVYKFEDEKQAKGDNLVIYFSGHGHYDESLKEGYWVPHDAKYDAEVDYLSYSYLQKVLAAIQAHHIVLIVDSCYSGAVLVNEKKTDPIERLERDPSRWILASGRNEVVPDGAAGENSPFATQLLDLLERRSGSSLSVQSLIVEVTHNVVYNSTQTPIGQPLQNVGHKGGEFVFHPRRNEEKALQELEAKTKAAGDDILLTLVSLQMVLQELPAAGKYALEAMHAAELLKNEIYQKQTGFQEKETSTESVPPAPEKFFTPPQLPVQDEMITEKKEVPLAVSKEEELEWKIAQRIDTAEAYADYMSLYKKGFYYKKAGQKIHQKSQKEWDNTPKNDEGYRAFLKKFPYPGLPFYEESKKELEANAKRHWKSLQENITVGGLRNFIEKHPESTLIEAAQQKIEEEEAVLLEIARRTKNPQIYIKTFSGEAYLKRIGFPLPEMLLIKGGEFMMGSEEYNAEKPVHKVTLSDFYLGKYPLTFEEFDAYCEAAGIEKSSDKGWGRGRLPLIDISWDKAHAYCVWLKDLTGQDWRLPTEAEWEYAAGGGAEKRTKWAGTNQESELGDYSWYDKNAGGQTHPVGQKKPNALGLYDMSGNVWEWCNDWFGSYASEAQTNPPGAKSGRYRVYRGGGWRPGPDACRVAYRPTLGPSIRSDYLGFRLARSV